VRQMWGIWQVPIYYMDNLDFTRKRFWPERAEEPFSLALIESALHDDGLYVFDFHPIHLLLNTPNAGWYSAVRERFLQGESTARLRYEGSGARWFYGKLLGAMSASACRSTTIIAGLRSLTNEDPIPRDPIALGYDFNERLLGF
jgi:hypothetical protein